MPVRILRVKENKPPSPEHAACPCFGRAGNTRLYETGAARTCALLGGTCTAPEGTASWLTCATVDTFAADTLKQFVQQSAHFFVGETEVSVTLSDLYRIWNGFELPVEPAARKRAAKLEPHLYVIAKQL